jgi:hypothetical protein
MHKVDERTDSATGLKCPSCDGRFDGHVVRYDEREGQAYVAHIDGDGFPCFYEGTAPIGYTAVDAATFARWEEALA